MADSGSKKRRVEDATEAEQDKAGSTRPQPSCTECQRRKQKCSRKWPCNHCSARKVPHLCQFGANKAGHVEEDIDPSKEAIGLIKFQLETESELPETDGFKTWGYMPDHQHYQLGVESGQGIDDIEDEDDVQREDMNKALQTIPSRYISDNLVQNFLYNVNYLYYSIYPPTFLDDYAKWWTARASSQKLSSEFTCLLLRIFALSSQYSGSSSMRKSLEFELGEPVQKLTWRFHRAAEQLSRSFTPGTGGLYRVQQLFISAYWFKSEAKFVESWHALASSVREAQELGLHKDSISKNLSDFDREMRRRVWALLYMWDWQMSRWLSRPIIINHKSCNIVLPTLNLENSSTEAEGLPSPFTHIALQAQLSRDFSEKLSSLPDGPLSAENIMAFQKAIDDWFASFPDTYDHSNPDTRWDADYPFVIQQRRHLHATGLMAKLDPFKPYLTKTQLMKPLGLSPETDDKFKAMGVDIALDMIEACRGLFELTFPSNARYHFTMFATFDTAAVLCSALIQDKEEHSLPRRKDVIAATASAVQLMRLVAPLTRAGEISFKVLSRLVYALPLMDDEREAVSQIVASEKIESSLWKKSQSKSISPSMGSASITSSQGLYQAHEPVLTPESVNYNGSSNGSGIATKAGITAIGSESRGTRDSSAMLSQSPQTLGNISSNNVSNLVLGVGTTFASADPSTSAAVGEPPELGAGAEYGVYTLPHATTTVAAEPGMAATGWDFPLDPNLPSFSGAVNASVTAARLPTGPTIITSPATTSSYANGNGNGSIQVGPTNLENIDFGDLGAIWNWDTLNLGPQP